MASETNFSEYLPGILQGAKWTAALGLMLAFFRWILTLAGGRQDGRIAELEAVQQDINSKLMALGQGMHELMAAVYHLDPSHVSLERARNTLAEVFPIKGHAPNHPEK